MKMVLQPNAWSCLPTAFAICFEQSPAEIIDAIGHDGSEILFPEESAPGCYRGFDQQEIIDVCYNDGIMPILIEAFPHVAKKPVFHDSQMRLKVYLQDHIGILLGRVDGRNHAVAWDREIIWDPTGKKYEITEFEVHTFIVML
jgi:hypothetical protein